MCDCIQKLDDLLKEHNTQIDVDLMFFCQSGAVRPHISVSKIDKKKRGSPKFVLVKFCPFCGEKYNKDDEVSDASI